MFKLLLKLLTVSLSLGLLVIIGAGMVLQHYMATPLVLERDYAYTLKPGGSLGGVAYTLAAEGIIPLPKAFLLASRLLSTDLNVQAGEYVFRPGLTPQGLLQQLQSGDVKSYRFAMIEGQTLRQVLMSAAEAPSLKRELIAGDIDWSQLLAVTADYPSFEGLFYPDTYQYALGVSDIELFRQAYARMQRVLDEEWRQREKNLPYKTAYEALIMASLIERETGVASERPEIAGVFVRRLRKGMRLQTDPAVIYGLGANFDGNLRSRHLKDSGNLYNTYRHGGLPPTPIALAGREAIHAALHPKAGDSLYFVAKGDGSHYFSDSLQQHNQAVRKYQIEQRRSDYRSN